ncbi:MAG TPA: uroporphyrinogen-III synthase [Chitinolyticbacter sp.]|nr:uroporphyrinogen-III synthase [Chitinolyticbacter sp.]
MSALAGRRIWVTRPCQQARTLADLLRATGAVAVQLPLLEIAPPLDAAPLEAALARLASFDLAVFVSPSALDAVFTRLASPWPARLPAAVVGPGSAARASGLGITRVIAPAERYDSEGLLAELDATLPLHAKQVLLLRGDGGREVLPQGLAARGATLTTIAAYRRLPPAFDEARITAELDAGCDGVVISSSEAAQHLFSMVGATTRERLQSLQYFAPHPRIAAALHQLGVGKVVLTAAGDTGIVDTMCRHYARMQ